MENEHFDSLGRLFASRNQFLLPAVVFFFGGGNPVKAGRKVCSGLMDGKFLGPKLEVDEKIKVKQKYCWTCTGFQYLYIPGGDRRISSIIKERVSW